MPANLENSAVATGLEEVSVHSNPKGGQGKRMFKLLHNCTYFTCWQRMLTILQDRFQQYVNQELPDVQAGFRKSRGTRDQIVHMRWIIEKEREFQKNIHFCFIDYAKTFDCVDNNKLWKIWKEMGIPAHLTCLLRNLYAVQETTVRTGHGTRTGSKLGKEYIKDPAYLTYMQSTSRKMPGWMKHKLESRLLGGEISPKLQMCR